MKVKKFGIETENERKYCQKCDGISFSITTTLLNGWTAKPMLQKGIIPLPNIN